MLKILNIEDIDINDYEFVRVKLHLWLLEFEIIYSVPDRVSNKKEYYSSKWMFGTSWKYCLHSKQQMWDNGFIKKYHDAYNEHLMFQKNLIGNNLFRGLKSTIGCMILLLPFLDIIRMSMSTVSFLTLRDYGIICLQSALPWPLI